ncbi:MAG: helix-turn-helix transcriptional regulator [Candidatus Paceibacterota bacterium]|jgi:transcriptional regulator with XRE-family HTH domain
MKNEEITYTLIGSKIREARQEANMSQKDLAKSIGFDSSTAISLIEAGQRKISIEDLEKICKILQKDIKFFLGKKEDENNVIYALRADKDLTKKDKDSIEHFINCIKQKDGGK